jgi:hypothetical protein
VLGLTACSAGSPKRVPDPTPPDQSASPVPTVSRAATVLQPDRDVPVAAHAPWTVLVYLDGRNVSEAFAARALDQLGSIIAPAGSLNVAIMAGRIKGFSDAPGGGIAPFESTKLLIPDGKGQLVELADLGDVSMGRPGALREFVANGLGLFPADHVALVLWGPGAGWAGFGVDQSGPAPELMGLGELADDLLGALQDSAHAPLDVLAFSSSLMAGYEVASSLSPVAEVMLAAETPLPGDGLALDALAGLQSNPPPDARAVAAALSQATTAAAARAVPPDPVSLTTVDLQVMPAVAAALDAWADRLTTSIGSEALLLGRARAAATPATSTPVLDNDPALIDLGSLAQAMAAQGSASGADEFGPALAPAVIATSSTPSAPGFTGLSIHFPQPGQPIGGGYDRLESGGGWLRMLTALAAQFDASGSAGDVRFVSNATVVTPGTDGSVRVTAPLSVESVASTTPTAAAPPSSNATSSTAKAPGSSVTVSPSAPASPSVTVSNLVIGAQLDVGLRTGPTTVQELIARTLVVGPAATAIEAVWDRQLLSALSGDRSVQVHLAIDDRRGPLSAAYIPFSLQDGSTTTAVVAQVLFDRPKHEVTGLRWYTQDLMGTWTEITAAPGSSAAPRVPQHNTNGEVQWTTSSESVAAVAPVQWGFRTVAQEAVARLTVFGLGTRDTVAVQIP